MQLSENDYGHAIEYIRREQFRGNDSIRVIRKGDTIEAFYTFGSNPPHLMARWLPEDVRALKKSNEVKQELFNKTSEQKRP